MTELGVLNAPPAMLVPRALTETMENIDGTKEFNA